MQGADLRVVRAVLAVTAMYVHPLSPRLVMLYLLLWVTLPAGPRRLNA